MYISSEYVYSLFVILNETHRGVQMACCVFVRFFFYEKFVGWNERRVDRVFLGPARHYIIYLNPPRRTHIIHLKCFDLSPTTRPPPE